MSQHLSTQTWTVMDGKKSLIHIETSADCTEAGVHICSINKKDWRVANLIMLSPELLAVAYQLVEGKKDIDSIRSQAQSIIHRSLIK